MDGWTTQHLLELIRHHWIHFLHLYGPGKQRKQTTQNSELLLLDLPIFWYSAKLCLGWESL